MCLYILTNSSAACRWLLHLWIPRCLHHQDGSTHRHFDPQPSMPTVRAGIPHLSEVKTTAGPAAEITVQSGQYTDSGLFHPILKLPIVIVPTYPQPNTSSQKTKAIPQIESLAAGHRTLSFWPCRPSSSRTLSSPLSCACMEGSDTGVAASPLWL